MAAKSFSAFDIVVFPTMVGIVAGIIVALIQWGFMRLCRLYRRRKAKKEIRVYLGKQKEIIYKLPSSFVQMFDSTIDEGSLQWEVFEGLLTDLPFRLIEWSQHLSIQESVEMTQLVSEFNRAIARKDSGVVLTSQEICNGFFTRVEAIEWLDFNSKP